MYILINRIPSFNYLLSLDFLAFKILTLDITILFWFQSDKLSRLDQRHNVDGKRRLKIKQKSL